MSERRSCTYAPCDEPAHLVVLLAFGELPLCEAHWRAARGELEQCTTFERAQLLTAAGTAPGVPDLSAPAA